MWSYCFRVPYTFLSGRGIVGKDLSSLWRGRLWKSIQYLLRGPSDKRSASSDGIEIDGRLTINFHTMSLPVASFIWHCPYIVIFSSDNGRVRGRNYHEYTLIKINGEVDKTTEYAENNFVMKRKDNFPGWEAWKEESKKGFF